MSYCEKCMKIVDTGPKCPHCRNKKLRPPAPADPVFLLEKDAMLAASIEDILAQNDIPCLKRGQLGEGIVAHIGYTLETYKIHVPHAALDAARELLLNFIEEDVT